MLSHWDAQSMEGTLGAADRSPFREGERGAALNGDARESGFARRAREGSSSLRIFAAQVSPYLRRSELATWGV
jgi:hypothetical protein